MSQFRIVINSLLLIGITTILLFLFPSKTSAFETGFKFPSDCRTNGSSCENMEYQDNNYNSWTPGKGEEVKVTFSNFNIPENAEIDDIHIKMRIRSNISGSSWGVAFSDDNGQTFYNPYFCSPTNPISCQYNSGTSFNSISTITFTWQNTNKIKRLTGKIINSPQFLFKVYGINSFTLKNTDIDVLLLNVRYHIPDPYPTPTPLSGITPYNVTSGFTTLLPYRLGTFFHDNIGIPNFERGDKVILSSNPDGTGNVIAADLLIASNTGNSFTFNAVDSCSLPISKTLPPTDVSDLVSTAFPSLSISLRDTCLREKVIGPIYVVHIKNIPPTPTPSGPAPFLDLPWNYSTSTPGRSFTEAALAINSFFDHKYPLISRSILQEPPDAKNITIAYDGLKRNDYSSHDGYDWGSGAKTKFGVEVLAAASGTATYHYDNFCGHQIHIDHNNNYQTRYCHLQKEELIVGTHNTSAEVIKGQKIGLVGYSGNVYPEGEDGSHLHFTLVEDKNKDGNFADNIPDGLTDPFGWQSTDEDPWENYTFEYLDENRTGNKSYYLWSTPLEGLDASLTANGGVFTSDNVQVSMPQNAVNTNANIQITPHPTVQNNPLESIGPMIKILVKSAVGAPITTFATPFELIFDFTDYDIELYKTASLAIYSSSDGTNWTKENTTIDLVNKKASANIDHLSYFALMAEAADTTPPTTSVQLEGLQGQPKAFRSSVLATLIPEDDADGLGIDYTLYKIGDGEWQEYTTPLSFAKEGLHELSFFSVDRNDNNEDEKKVQFSIDTTVPEVSFAFDPEELKMIYEGIDASGSASISKIQNGKFKYTVTASDPASNTAKLAIDERSIGKIHTLEINSLQYNDLPAIIPENNKVLITYVQNRDKSLKTLIQGFYLKGEALLILTYDAKSNTTHILKRENGINSNIKITGLKILKVTSQKSELTYTII
jgi:murein DD-endopeptidase MepM/ murein hydrolase activator NlpD